MTVELYLLKLPPLHLPEPLSQDPKPKPRFCISFTCHYFIILKQSSWGL